MDHIEEVTDPAYPPLRIPCLSPHAYDQMDWSSYPERAGLSKDRLFDGDFSQRPPHETAAFLQDWLYFGVLWVVLGNNVSKSDYVRWDTETGFGIVTTKLLDQHIHRRLLEIRELIQADYSSAQAIVQDIETCLSTLSKLCMLNTFRTGSHVWPLPADIDLSIRHLGEYFCTALFSQWDFQYECPLINFSFPCAYLPISRMIEERRCPSEMNMVSRTFSSASAYYATQLKRPKETPRLDHSSCSDTVCVARQLDETTYQTQHSTEGCDCAHLGPPIDEIVSIIQSGQIPLVSIQTTKTRPYLKIAAEPYKRGKQFIAFSHVWSDGLGNPVRNTLPRCQILRIQGILDEVLSKVGTLSLINMGAFNTLSRKFQGPSLLFWMDTLCIPVEAKYREVRTQAIRSMKRIYEDAFRVVVLDAELQASPQGVSTEAFMRISLSPWMRRLWTLQEGVCAQRLYIKFADGFFELQTEYGPNGNHSLKRGGWIEPRSRQVYATPHADARSFYWSFLTLRLNVTDRPDRKMIGMKSTSGPPSLDREIRKRCNAIMQAYMAALYRSTSRKEDQFLCMASLVGWELNSLRGVPFEKRMHALLRTESHLPQGLLFMMGPRMAEPGWTWAVSQFGSSKVFGITVPLGDTTPGRVVTGQGFAVKYPGLALPSSCTLDDLQCLTINARLENGPRVRFVVQRAEGSRKGDELAEEKIVDSSDRKQSPERGLYVIFWDHTMKMVPGVPMVAAVVSTSRDSNCSTDGKQADRVFKFESVATLEILGTANELDQGQQDVDDDAQLVERMWIIE
ncbi:hypothetical protein P170DRAFT_463998 [Aspergillus steynii IBT 23096]|uniref:Heterokaryon incompatibility domain-containing protein n=1 Tax=Aspergillus steynii IBT 23096 TaxID=1392250 RepID=A0A2I2GDM4_9EURO|nr:uncharacterized protein P170DRAFT_463998 [Aspergillus steynii IBT 23096]PLB50970.1 hypothetical protein P170DRAFT_463998 [Aspergillus steynii IBT 23096]